MSNFKYLDTQKLEEIAKKYNQVDDYEEKEEEEVLSEIPTSFNTSEMQKLLLKQLAKSQITTVTETVTIEDSDLIPEILFGKSNVTLKKSDTFLNFTINTSPTLINKYEKQNKIFFFEFNFLYNNKIFTYTYPSNIFYDFVSLKTDFPDISSYRLSIFILENKKQQYLYISERKLLSTQNCI